MDADLTPNQRTRSHESADGHKVRRYLHSLSDILYPAAQRLGKHSRVKFGDRRKPLRKRYGLLPLVTGTLLVRLEDCFLFGPVELGPSFQGLLYGPVSVIRPLPLMAIKLGLPEEGVYPLRFGPGPKGQQRAQRLIGLAGASVVALVPVPQAPELLAVFGLSGFLDDFLIREFGVGLWVRRLLPVGARWFP